ncbi:MAG: FtsX-like permease family protein, partial [Clostridium sp.]
EARQKIESSKKSLNKGEQDLKNNEIKFNKDMEEANKKIKDAENELIKGEAQYDNAVAVFEEAKKTLKPQIDKANSEIATLTKEKLELDNRLKTVEEKLKDPNITNEERLALEREKINLSAQITEKNFKINTISEGLKAYNKLLKEAQDRLNEAKRKVDYGKEELHKQKINLENGKRIAKGEFDKGKRALEDGKIKLAQGEEEYEKGRKEAELKIADGERKLAEAKEKVAAISEPEWYVLDREKNYSYMSYKSSTDSVDAIAQVFPLFFFLVAALVCLTTMTRMVDEQRVNMGTMKALGYSTWKIASKYLIYAAVASICGSVIGIIVGMNIFPTVIFEAYGMMFNIPELIKEFNLYYSSLATISVVGITTLAAYFACYKDLKEVPSSLMRPKAPPEGKRILLERISFVWNRLNFIGKVTARNIFRYKKRFLMTVIGISGCTALLLAGFGIKDSIEIIIDKQFGEIFKYNLEIGIEDDASIEDLERIDSYLTKNNGVLNYMNLESKYQKVYDDTTEKDVILMVPKEVENMEEFIVLRERGNGNAIELTDEGVVITEKLATTFNVRKGDSISVKDENGYSYNVKVIGVTENYVSHYMYMTANLYEKIHGATPRFNNILTTNEKIDKDFETNLSNKLSQDSKVASVGFNSGVKDSFSDTVSSLNIVVIVMIISAGALAFVVLYNLTNVNISERLREIATIKVLGFYDNEVSSYVFRENFILTFIGSLVGLGLGTALHRFIIITAEMDNFMFGRVLDVSSYLYAIVLTIVFAAVVNFAMYYKLRNVPMVESLKSVD